MAIGFDAVGSGNNGGGAATITWTHVVGSGSNRLMLIGVVIRTDTATVSSITVGSQNAIFLRRDRDTNNSPVTICNEVWYLKNPTSGSQTVTVTLSASLKACGGSCTYAGVDQTNTFDTSNSVNGANNTLEVTITLAGANEWTFHNIAWQGVATVVSHDSGQTHRWHQVGSGGSAASRATSHGDDKFESTSGNKTYFITISAISNFVYTAVAFNPVSEEVTSKSFSDGGAGVDAFLNPYRAMGFAQVGGGADSFGIPYRAMGFSDVGHGSELFQILFKALGFSDAGLGIDVFSLFLEKAFSDVGYGSDVFTKIITLLTKTFQDVGHGSEVFVVPFRALGFADVGHGLDAFTTPFRAMLFTELGHGVDAFVIPFRALGFADVAGGTDSFLKEALEAISKAFSETATGSDSYVIPFKAMRFADVGTGTGIFATPFRAMMFTDNGQGVDVFIIPFKALGFADVGAGLDSYVKEVLGAILKAFSDVGYGSEAFSKIVTLLSKNFADSVLATDTMVTAFRAMGFSQNAIGSDAFLIPFKALPFSDLGHGSDIFATPFRTMIFMDTGYGIDVFVIPFKALSFADIGAGLDAFSAYIIALITKNFIDAGAGLDAFSKKEGFTVGLPMILITTSGGILVNVGKKTVFISEDLKVKIGDMMLQELT